MDKYMRTASQTNIDPGSQARFSEGLILSNEITLASPWMALTL